MKQTLTVLLCVLLCACGTTSTLRGEQQTDYVLASCSAAGGVWKMLRGETQVAKLTTHGITGLRYHVTLGQGLCAIEAAK